MIVRHVRNWLQKPSTASRIKNLEEQTRMSQERVKRIELSPLERAWKGSSQGKTQ